MGRHKLLPLTETTHYILLALKEPLHDYAEGWADEQGGSPNPFLHKPPAYLLISHLNR